MSRYYVNPAHGYEVTPGAIRGGTSKPDWAYPTAFYVLDRVYYHAIVGAFPTAGKWKRPGPTLTAHERHAHALAKELNAADQA